MGSANELQKSRLTEVQLKAASLLAMGFTTVGAARTLGEYVERHEERAKQADNDLMADKSGEIKAILEHIRQEKAGTGSALPPSE